MSRLSFRKESEEHNFWQNYSDLMAGFLIVFIIASLVAYSNYKKYVDLYHEKGITEGNINDIVVKADLYNKITEFRKAQTSLNSEYFRYNDTYDRFECKVDVQFNSDDATLPASSKDALVEAGKELESILTNFAQSTNVAFKIVIDGRAARPHDVPYDKLSKDRKERVANLSYKRAKNLYDFWRSKDILSNIEAMNGEVFISGSGFDGQGRYTGLGKDGEDRNKTFIVQIIPYIQY